MLSFLQDVHDFIFPPVCPACCERLEQRDDIVCPACRFEMQEVVRPFCEVCARRNKKPGSRCCAIPQTGGGLSKARAFCLYNGIARDLIHQFKFEGRTEIADPMARMMMICWIEQLERFKYDLCLPVPLHQSRLNERGYNQSELLAEEFCNYSGLMHDPSILLREKHTERQSLIESVPEKVENVKDAFRVLSSEFVRGKRVLLVDDILTTGATAGSCASLLKRSGAVEVHLISFARA